MPQPRRQLRRDRHAFVAMVRQLLQLRDQGAIQPVAGAAFRGRQAEPLDHRRRLLAAGQEHGRQAPPLGGRRRRGPGSQQPFGLGGGLRHIESGRRPGRRGIPAIGVDRLLVARRITAHEIALRAGAVLDRDRLRLPGGEPFVQRGQARHLEGLGQMRQVGRAEHHDLVDRSCCRPLEPAWIEGGLVILRGGSPAQGHRNQQDRQAHRFPFSS